MTIVNDKKLRAVANLIGEMEVEGCCVCIRFNNSLEENRIDVPCDVGDCDGVCPFYSKDNFLKWIKEPNREREFVDLKRPKIEDFNNDYFEEEKRYIEALENYCNDLEDVLADTEYDLADEECTNRELRDVLKKIRGVLDEHY